MNKKCFTKQSRLLNLHQFIFVFQKPEYIKTTGITLLSRYNKLGFPRIGLAISKKYVKHAHERNRIKRHMRETFRNNQFKLSSRDFVLTINSKEIIHFTNRILITELEKLWSRHIC